jgi:DNA repair protein RadC
LPADARPREKLLARGPAALADAELLALLLRTGQPGEPVALERVRGLGPAKRAELAAVLEIARRALLQQLAARPVLAAMTQVKEYVSLQLRHLPHEMFAVLFLDGQHKLIRLEEMFRGTLTQTSVYPREVVKRALELHAGAVILAHNHPSGMAEPSHADRLLTDRLKAALQLVDVRVLDHLVVAGPCVTSFVERGLL